MDEATDPAKTTKGTGRLLRADTLVGVVLFAIAVGGGVLFGMSFTNPGGTTTTPTAPKEYEFPTADATSTISAAVGEVFLVQLESNAGSTGFDWKVTCSGGIQYINYTSVSTSTVMIGGELRHYYFRALTPGNESITLQNMRFFDPSQIAATIELKVTVT
ncbi:MAG: protease inhibitor I42 family protein [Nitrososphaerota archaeon]|nr:protease inhibitor I42 family protein [Nitrososphaerota archaeon]